MTLRRLVQREAKGHAIEVPEPEEKPSNVINLMDALRESLKANSKRGPSSGTNRKKRQSKARRGKAALSELGEGSALLQRSSARPPGRTHESSFYGKSG
jgi:DNA end-binding protein Ku